MSASQLETPRFGVIEVDDAAVWSFPSGLIGLPDHQRFLRLPFDTGEMPFEWFQSLDDPAFALLTASPKGLVPNYVVEAHPDDLTAIRLTDEVEGEIVCIVTVRDRLPDMTINLLAPVVLNPAERLGMQVPLVDSKYDLHHPLFPEAQGVSADATTE